MTNNQKIWTAVIIVAVIAVIYFWGDIMNAIGMNKKPSEGDKCMTKDATPKAGTIKNGVCVTTDKPNPQQNEVGAEKKGPKKSCYCGNMYYGSVGINEECPPCAQ